MSMRDQTGTDGGTVELEIDIRSLYQVARDMLDQCHYSAVHYWAGNVQRTTDDDGNTLTLMGSEVIDDWVTPIEYGVEWGVDRVAMINAMRKMVHPSFNLNRDMKAGIAALLVGSDYDWDDWVADAVLQTAVFGEVVYG